MTTIALTGPDGVLGRHIQPRLRQGGVDVLPVGRGVWDLRQCKTIEELDGVFAGAGAVIHCGALTPKPGVMLDRAELCDVNVRACVVLGAWAAKRNVPLIYVSSAGIYAQQAAPATEDAPLAPWPDGGLYGLTKLLGEMALVGLQADGLPLCVLRTTSIYGTGLPSEKLVAKFLKTAASGKIIAFTPPADDRVNLVHAADVADAVLAAIQRGVHGTFNIGGPAMISVTELATACIAVAGKGKIAVNTGQSTRPPVRRFDVSHRKAGEQLGYAPKVELSDGLRMMQEGRYVR